MYLCLDVGNTQIYGGIYDGQGFVNTFRFNSKQSWSSDLLGMHLKMVCQEHGIKTGLVKEMLISSVVPSIDYHLKNAAIKYFQIDPFFLKAGVKTGISVGKYKNPSEIGADLIAATVAVVEKYPNENAIIVDMGTATTITAVNDKKEFMGGVIMPGVKTQLDSITNAAEKLFNVEIDKPVKCIGLNTTNCLQSGIYYGHLGGVQSIVSRIRRECFIDAKSLVIGTGGFSRLYKEESLFDGIESDLVLTGLVKIFQLNS